MERKIRFSFAFLLQRPNDVVYVYFATYTEEIEYWGIKRMKKDERMSGIERRNNNLLHNEVNQGNKRFCEARWKRKI